jgi:hypothetical protein
MVLILLLVVTVIAHADQDSVLVSGFTFPVDSGPTDGRHAGPNFIAERTLFSLIFPCTLAVPFCEFETNGFQGTVVTEPERVVRIERNGNRFYRMVARQSITGAIVADGVTYSDCTIAQTLVATGGLHTDVPIEQATATDVEGTWVITGGSSCSGGAVNVNGHGTLEWLGNPALPPTYEGTIHISQN